MPITYNEQVKAPGVEIEYTMDQILELAKCRESFKDFMKHIIIVSLDQGRIPFQPFDYQKEMLEVFDKNRYSIMLSSRQSGKCLYFNSLVKIRNKKTGEIEEITMEELYNRKNKK